VFSLVKAMKDAMQTKGFGFVEIVSQCPESYGRRVGLSSAIDFLQQFKERSIRVEKGAWQIGRGTRGENRHRQVLRPGEAGIRQRTARADA